MDIDKIKKIVEESGNNLHYKVVDFLRSEDWYVLVSPYYTDSFSEKPREIDIIAEKNFSLGQGLSGFIGTVNIQLFIECKYIKEETVFWFDEKNKRDALDLVLRTTPLEDPAKYSMTAKHHFLDDSLVAKLFATKTQPSDGEVFYKAITQSLNGMLAYSKKGSMLPSVFNNLSNHKIQTILQYPIILCNDFKNLYKYNVLQKGDPEQLIENFQIETQYAYFDKQKNQRNEFFLIDVCSLKTISEYLKTLIEKDLAAIIQKIYWDQPR